MSRIRRFALIATRGKFNLYNNQTEVTEHPRANEFIRYDLTAAFSFVLLSKWATLINPSNLDSSAKTWPSLDWPKNTVRAPHCSPLQDTQCVRGSTGGKQQEFFCRWRSILSSGACLSPQVSSGACLSPQASLSGAG